MGLFNVELKKVVDDSYEIETGYNLQEKLLEDLKNGIFGKIKKFAIITDSIVNDLYAKDICKKIVDAGFKAEIFVFPEGEKSKVRKTKEDIEDAMLEKGYRRDCAIIAIGGGVVTDLAGFIAGTFGRGVPFLNYATTLLAAADASVGGKTAVDTPLATNLIGLFNQPKKVYIDIATWATLPKRQIYSGMAETIKHACLASSEFFDYLDNHMEEILNIEEDACVHIAEENCRIKYNVVMKDERESGLREVLNLGHTVGRAIETVSDYELMHGEAVSIGMVAEVMLSRKLGYMNDEQVERVINLLKKAHLPVEIPEYIDREKLVKKLYTDKKVRDGQLRFVIQDGIGKIVEYSDGVFAVPITEDVAREIIMSMKYAEKKNTAKIIAVAGKGGVGKTSLAAAMVKVLVKNYPDKKILAIDADPAVGLATALNIDVETTIDDIRKSVVNMVEDGDTKSALELLGEAKYQIFDAIVEADGFEFIAVGRPESAGCYCKINSYLKEVIKLVADNFDYIVIDGEAGIEQINRRVMEKVTHLVLVTDASRKGTSVIKKIKTVADELVMYEKIGVIANRLPNDKVTEIMDLGELELLSGILPDSELANIDIEGKSVFDITDTAPVVKGVETALKKLEIIK